MRGVFSLFFLVALLGTAELARGQASTVTYDDDGISSNNDMVKENDVSYETLDQAIIPRLTSVQRFSPRSQFYFGVAAAAAYGPLPPFENSFTPLNIKAADLTTWQIIPAVSNSITHVVVTIRSFFDDYTRSTAKNLGKDPGASVEAAAITGFAATQIIGTQLLTEIGTVCASCTNARRLAQWWGRAAQQSVLASSDGVIYLGDLTSSTGTRAVVGHTFSYNVSVSLNAVQSLSNDRIQSAADLATIIATAFARASLVQQSMRAAAAAVSKNGYVDLNGKRQKAKSRLTRILASASCFATGVGSETYAVLRMSNTAPPATSPTATPRELVGVQTIAKRRVVEVRPVPLPEDGKK